MMVLKVGAQDTCAVYPGCNVAGDCSGALDMALGQHFDAAGRVVERNPLNLRMLIKKTYALRERNRMRVHLRQIAERGSGKGDEIMDDPKIDLTHNVKIIFQQQIIILVDRASQGIFNGRQAVLRFSAAHALKDIGKRFARAYPNRGAQQFVCSLLAE